MIIKYPCSTDTKKPTTWTGEVNLYNSDDPCEMKVTARHSSFHLICGNYEYGNYLCIPTLGISSEVADLNDTFWNLERLMMKNPELSEVDAISIIYALKAAKPYLSI